jgi:hypothetical protein
VAFFREAFLRTRSGLVLDFAHVKPRRATRSINARSRLGNSMIIVHFFSERFTSFQRAGFF